jgi:hypothetical protein
MRSAAVASPSPNRNSIATLSTCAKGFALSYKPVHQQHDFIWLAPVLAKRLSPWHIEAYIKHRDHHNFPLTSLAPIAADMKYWVSITSLEAMGRLLMMMAKTISINRTCSKKKRNCMKETKERGRRNRSWEIFRRKDVCKQTLIQHKVQAWILMCRPCLHSGNTGKQNPNNDYTHFCSCVLRRLELISNRSLFQ